MPSRMSLSSTIFLLVAFLSGCNLQITQSVHRLQSAVSTYQPLVEKLRLYMREKHEALKKMDRLVQQLANFSVDMNERDLEDLTSHPVRAMRILSEMSQHRLDIAALLANSQADGIYEDIARLPSRLDYVTVVESLARLQLFYGQQAEFSEVTEEDNHSRALTAQERLQVGRVLMSREDNDRAIMYLNKSIEIFKRRNESDHEKEAKLLLSEHLNKLGDFVQAAKYSNEVLKFYEENENASETVSELRSRLEVYAQNLSISETYVVEDDPETEDEIRMCRGEALETESKDKQPLKCYLKTNNNPILILAPAKVEDIHHETGLSYYHDVLTEKEINVIKRAAGNRFDDSKTHAMDGKVPDYDYRLSNTAWIDDEEDERLSIISRRVAAMVGLDLSHAEPYQAVSYGIGGFYGHHYDYINATYEITSEEDLKLIGGNRLATWIFYLNDVRKGGATVFPKIGKAVWPEKGGAAFWWNLHQDGTGNQQTLHLACPVLEGYKWVSNKWFHEFGNEFTRPCQAG